MIPKFRAYIKKDKVMCDVLSIDFNSDEFNRIVAKYPDGAVITLVSFNNDDNIELMQSTCLFDKNGQEIFEGDIVTNGHTKQLVKFGKFEHEGNFGDIAQFIGFDLLLGLDEYEVIGHKFMPEFVGVFE